MLDDKRKTIRRPAANLLLRLPATGYQQRMTARAAACVAVTPARAGSLFPPRLKQEVKLEVTLPDKFAADWTRNALEETPPQGIGAKSWWLQQMLSAVPLLHWETAGQCSAAELVAAAHSSEHRDLLLRGWLLAAQYQRNVPWMIAMARSNNVAAFCSALTEGFAALSVQREQVLLALLLGETPPAQGIIFDLLCVITKPWSEELSGRVLAYQFDAGQRHCFEPLAYYLHPHYLPACRTKFQQTQSESAGAFETRLLSVMQFREELYQTFEEGV